MTDVHERDSGQPTRPPPAAALPTTGPLSLSPGNVFADFELIAPIGQGGMGQVWEATQISLERRVALKLLLPGRSDQRALDYFSREARAGGRLSHRGIAAVYSYGEEDGVPWIAMELVEGSHSMAKVLAETRKVEQLSPDHFTATAKRFAELAEAMESAHSEGVIHRDLKPQNVLIDREERIKVVDFGLARIADELSLSATGEVVGTFAYMSPEQIAARRVGIDHRTDIFSLGVMLYEALCLRRPFEGDTAIQIQRKILFEEPGDPRTLRSKVPHDLVVIAGKCLEKDPGRRYRSMAEVAGELRRHLAGESILARPPGLLERALRWSKRHPTPTASAAVAAAAFVVIAWLGLVASGNASRATRNAELAEARRIESERRAEEVQRVAEFQADQLQRIDLERMGWTIRRGTLERVRAAGERAGLDGAQLEEQAAHLEELLAGADFSGLALATLDEHLFAGALEAIEDLDGQPETRARLLQALGETLAELGLLERAEEFLRRALALRSARLGDEDGLTLDARRKLGSLLLSRGAHEEAERLLLDALEGSRRVLGDEHPQTLQALRARGTQLVAEARFEEAEVCAREALEIARRIHEAGDPRTIEPMAEMGQLLGRLGRFEEAEAPLREALALCEDTLGARHKETLSSLNDLGLLLMKRGAPEEGIVLLERALEGRRDTLGDAHHSTLTSANNLATALMNRAQFDAAERLLRDTLRTRRRILGERHPQTLTSILNLAALSHSLGRTSEAEDLSRQALRGLQQTLGNAHPTTLQALGNLGTLMRDVGRLDEAEALFIEALEGTRETLGDNHPMTLNHLNSLAALFYSKGDLASAQVRFAEALEIADRTQGEGHPDTLNIANNLAVVCRSLGELGDAASLFRRAIAGYRPILGDGHPATLNVARSLRRMLEPEAAPSPLLETPPADEQALEALAALLDHLLASAAPAADSDSGER